MWNCYSINAHINHQICCQLDHVSFVLTISNWQQIWQSIWKQFHALLPCFGSLSGVLLFLVLCFAFFATTSSTTSSGVPVLLLRAPNFPVPPDFPDLPRGEALACREAWQLESELVGDFPSNFPLFLVLCLGLLDNLHVTSEIIIVHGWYHFNYHLTDN